MASAAPGDAACLQASTQFNAALSAAGVDLTFVSQFETVTAAVVNALDFLEHDRGMDRAIAYAYLSAAADFAISQVVDRTVGVHGLIAKAHFG